MTTVVETPSDLASLLGSSLGTTPWRVLSQSDVDTFGAVTHDQQWIHVDVERAKSGPFGRTIAHGYLTLSLVGPLFAELLHVREVAMVVNYGLERVRFPAPVPAGARVRLTATVAEISEINGAVQLVADAAVEIEGSTKPGCVARPVYRYFP
ncbi:MaoC family dehydratase [Gordonia sp. C13]|uniref:MaoC family dehydratase n=1 Tax=Gordonia sp. C13 TaxID=2935078 RepID=UPI00200ADAFB|nr:MaoC family dehydratase [Gordonia sp. C13]MCK8616701.1 MaoC family dehydratase [Gordonia sp. C13]